MKTVCLLAVSLAFMVPSASYAATGAATCTAPEYRQFDFWVGDWDTYEENGKGPSEARNRVDVILGGCVVREVYRQNDGLIGRSFSIYDATRKLWQQTWVTNRGQLLVLEGGLKNGRMVLTGSQLDKKGQRELIRGIWYPVKGGVRETATRSTDGGKTWTPLFDIVFRPHRGTGH